MTEGHLVARRLWPLGAAAAAAALGLLLLVVGLLVATVGAPAESETLTVRPTSSTAVAVTAPGVLELRADKVQVSATAEGDRRVVLAVARTADADAYLGSAARAELTGRDGSGAARLETKGSGADALPDPAGVDIWAASSSGTGSAELSWTARPGRWTLVAVAVSPTGVAAPTQLDLTWRPRESTSPAVALLAVGLLLLVAGGVAAAIIVLQRRSPVEDVDGDSPSGASPPGAAASSLPGAAAASLPSGPLTMELPVVPAGSVPSSRRAARLAERAERAGRGQAQGAPAQPSRERGAAPEQAQQAAEAPTAPAAPNPPSTADADPPTSMLPLGRHRTADLFSSEPRPGRRTSAGTGSLDLDALRPGTDEPSAPSRAFRFPRADAGTDPDGQNGSDETEAQR